MKYLIGVTEDEKDFYIDEDELILKNTLYIGTSVNKLKMIQHNIIDRFINSQDKIWVCGKEFMPLPSYFSDYKITISTQNTCYINIMDCDASDILKIMEMIMHSKLDEQEKTFFMKSINDVYQKYDNPILENLYTIYQHQENISSRLLYTLHSCIYGNYCFLNHHTNIDTDCRVINFKVDDDIYDIGMLLIHHLLMETLKKDITQPIYILLNNLECITNDVIENVFVTFWKRLRPANGKLAINLDDNYEKFKQFMYIFSTVIYTFSSKENMQKDIIDYCGGDFKETNFNYKIFVATQMNSVSDEKSIFLKYQK